VENVAEAVKTIDLPLGPQWMRALLGKAIRDRASRQLPESVAPQLSAALRRLLELSDADLATLCEVTAAELGAWCGQGDALPTEAFISAIEPLARLGDG
jgi:hypothetical protein